MDKSLKELFEKWRGEIPKEDYSSQVQLRTYNLFLKKINEYEIDDLRFMIGQQYGLKYLLPIAINYLEEDIMTEGLYYEGDLLNAVFHIPKYFWKKNLKSYSKIYEILLNNKSIIDDLNTEFEANRDLISDREKFLKILINKGNAL
ncbi:MAG: hypothetical protein EVB11_11500 [Winogradskyella sp.]|nr:MAG: hypothetical protein EVB11_11500 [Winogradskyella sp.]